jgi:uncharacterized protein with gpF-like domain
MPTRNLHSNLLSSTNRLMRLETQIAKEITDAYVEALDRIRRDLSRIYERYAENGVLTHAEMSRFNRLTGLRNQIIKDVRPALTESRELTRVLASVQYEAAFYTHAWSIEQAAGVSLQWGMLNERQVAAAIRNEFAGNAFRRIPRETQRRLRQAISQGLIRGQSMPGMMANIREAITATRNEALRIARTEAHRAREEGSWRATQEAYDNGVRMVRRWDATLDNRTRSSHGSMDGQERAVVEKDGSVQLERPFQSPDGGQTNRPGNFGIAAEDIHCRCVALDVIEGLEPELRRTRDRGVEPYQTFVQWANDRGVRASRYGQRYNYVRRR